MKTSYSCLRVYRAKSSKIFLHRMSQDFIATCVTRLSDFQNATHGKARLDQLKKSYQKVFSTNIMYTYRKCVVFFFYKLLIYIIIILSNVVFLTDKIFCFM